MAEKMEKKGDRSKDKSYFSLTCSLLSQYLKKNGSFGDLGLAMFARPLDQQAQGNFRVPTTISYKPEVKVLGKDPHHTDFNTDKIAPNSMELLLSQPASFNPVVIKEESGKPSNSKGAGKGQLTIFYGGKVMVFDNFPEDKAMDLMLMASKESIAAPTADSILKNSSMPMPPPSDEPVVALKSSPLKPTQANSSDMPIARRNSLHRFLEKRKDRIGKAPYQVHGGLAALEAAKPEENQPWLSLGPQGPKPECSSQSSR